MNIGAWEYSALLVALGCLARLIAARTVHRAGVRRALALLERGWALPLVAGVAAAAVYGWVWGDWPAPAPVVHDEAAYLFQAELFATLRWTADPPPVVEPFTQFHLLLEPVFAAKYPPGHSLILAPGILLGIPALMPLLLSGLTAATMVGLTRRIAGGGAAVLATMLWTGAAINLQWRPSYFSQLTTGLFVLAAWYCLFRWSRGHRDLWLGLLGIVVGWGAISRPATMLAYAIPIGVVLLYQCVQTRGLRPVMLPAVFGGLILLLLPTWASRTTGDWRVWPTSTYTSDYMPFDRLGFGLDSTPPRRAMPQQMTPLLGEFRALHENHTSDRYPLIVWERTVHVTRESWSGWRSWLLPLGLIGLISLGGIIWVGVSGAVIHLLLYGFYAHPPGWTLYYLELAPLAAIATAAGLIKATSWVSMTRLERSANTTRKINSTVALAISFAATTLTLPELIPHRSLQAARRAPDNVLRSTFDALPEGKRIVVVRYDAEVAPHTTVVRNQPHLSAATTWFVHEDARGIVPLLQAYPDRSVYLLDIAAWTLLPVRIDTP